MSDRRECQIEECERREIECDIGETVWEKRERQCEIGDSVR